MNEQKNDTTIISYEEFREWHTANGADYVPDDTMQRAYVVYGALIETGGISYAVDRICGHPIWGENGVVK